MQREGKFRIDRRNASNDQRSRLTMTHRVHRVFHSWGRETCYAVWQWSDETGVETKECETTMMGREERKMKSPDGTEP